MVDRYRLSYSYDDDSKQKFSVTGKYTTDIPKCPSFVSARQSYLAIEKAHCSFANEQLINVSEFFYPYFSKTDHSEYCDECCEHVIAFNEEYQDVDDWICYDEICKKTNVTLLDIEFGRLEKVGIGCNANPIGISIVIATSAMGIKRQRDVRSERFHIKIYGKKNCFATDSYIDINTMKPIYDFVIDSAINDIDLDISLKPILTKFNMYLSSDISKAKNSSLVFEYNRRVNVISKMTEERPIEGENAHFSTRKKKR